MCVIKGNEAALLWLLFVWNWKITFASKINERREANKIICIKQIILLYPFCVYIVLWSTLLLHQYYINDCFHNVKYDRTMLLVYYRSDGKRSNFNYYINVFCSTNSNQNRIKPSYIIIVFFEFLQFVLTSD